MLKIRTYQPEDLPRVLDITIAAWEPVFASFMHLLGADIFALVYPDWREEKRQALTSQCAAEHGEHITIAEWEGYVAGFIVYYCNTNTGIGEISHNAVDPAYQNKGIATALYMRVLDDMKSRGMRCAQVSTGGDPSHAPARRAYEKAGFQHALPGVNYFQLL